MPISPPELPTKILPFTATGAIVMVSPLVIAPNRTAQTSLPVLCIHRDGVIVQGIVENLAVVIDLAAIDHIAAGHALR